MSKTKAVETAARYRRTRNEKLNAKKLLPNQDWHGREEGSGSDLKRKNGKELERNGWLERGSVNRNRMIGYCNRAFRPWGKIARTHTCKMDMV